MKRKKNKTKNKTLFIELKKDIRKIITGYCKEAGVSSEDRGFAMGYLSGLKDPGAMEQALFLLQLYFFAGVYYAHTTKNYKYEYLSEESKAKMVDDIKAKLAEALKKPKTKLTYVG